MIGGEKPSCYVVAAGCVQSGGCPEWDSYLVTVDAEEIRAFIESDVLAPDMLPLLVLNGCETRLRIFIVQQGQVGAKVDVMPFIEALHGDERISFGDAEAMARLAKALWEQQPEGTPKVDCELDWAGLLEQLPELVAPLAAPGSDVELSDDDLPDELPFGRTESP
jgi:hypothetical protein